MLSIRLNNVLLDLDADAGMEVVLSCPLFDKDSIERVFSYPFKLPRTPRNQSALLHIARFDSLRRKNTLSGAVLFIGGSEYETGELVVIGGDEQYIEVQFRNNPVKLFDDLAKFNVNDILETISTGQTGLGGYWKYSMQSYPQTYSIFFDGGGIATYTPGGGETIDIATLAFASLINSVVPNIVLGASSGVITLSAAKINEFPVTETVALALDEYKSEGTQDYEDMATYIADIIATPDDRVAFPLMYWQGFYSNKATHYRSLMNYIKDGVLIQNPEYAVDEDWIYGLLPLVRWPYAMSKIGDQVGVVFTGAIWEKADIQALLILNNYTIDHVQKDRYPVSSTLSSDDFKFQNSFLQKIDLNNHVPKMTGAEFVKQFMASFALFSRYGDGYLSFFKKKDLIEQEPVDWTDFVSTEDYDHVIKTEKGFTMDYTRRKEDKYSPAVPEQLDPFVQGDGEEKFYIPGGTFHEDNIAPETIGLVRIPHTVQPGECGYLGGKPSQYPLHYLFDRGLMTSDSAIEYPYATNDDEDNDDNSIGDYSLRWNTDKGLYKAWWKGVADLGLKPELSIRCILPVGELFRLRNWQNARVRFFHPNGAVVLVLRSVEFQVRSRMDSGWVTARVRGVVE